MRPKSENPSDPGLCSSNSAIPQSRSSPVIGPGSVALSPLETGISGIDSATPPPPPQTDSAGVARSHLELAMAAPRCTFHHPDGRRCGSAAVRGTDLCYYHRARRAEADAVRALPRVTDPASFQRALQQVLSDTYSGRLRARTAGQLLYGLQIAALNLREPG